MPCLKSQIPFPKAFENCLFIPKISINGMGIMSADFERSDIFIMIFRFQRKERYFRHIKVIVHGVSTFLKVLDWLASYFEARPIAVVYEHKDNLPPLFSLALC